MSSLHNDYLEQQYENLLEEEYQNQKNKKEVDQESDFDIEKINNAIRKLNELNKRG